MNRWRWVLILLLPLFFLLTAFGHSEMRHDLSSRMTRPAYKPGEILVKFKTGVTRTHIRAMQDQVGAQAIREVRSIRVHQIKLPPTLNVEEALELYKKNPNVEYAEPNYFRYLAATPDDTYFAYLWGLNNTGQTVSGTSGTADADINAPEAWDITTGSDSIIIAVIDSGVNYSHPDLAANIWTNAGEIPGNGIDDDGNGYVDDVRGWDFIHNDNDPMDANGHGTHVAGTIAARGNNALGVTGVCWRAKIMPLRVTDAFGFVDVASEVSALDYARRMGARIINLSLGGYLYSQAEYDAIALANSAGILVVAAAGNESNDNDSTPSYPASYNLPNIISVAATDQNDLLASFSNYGATSVHVAAPGTNILSTQTTWDTIWSDNFDDGDISNWTTGGTNNTWGLSTTAYSGTYSLSDSPSGLYQNGTASFARAPVLNLSSYGGCQMYFRVGGISASEADSLYVQTSTDGSNWTNQAVYFPDYGDSLPFIYGPSFSDQWYIAQVDLGAYDGEPTVYIRFYFTTDSSSTADGWYIDSVYVVGILSSSPASTYGYKAGTSMATPHVAGLAGLIWSFYPALTMSQVKETISYSVDRKASLSGRLSTGGRINAYNAFVCHQGTLNAPTNLNATLNANGSVGLAWTDNSGFEAGFKIERKTGASGTYEQIDRVYRNQNSYTDITATSGKTHYYRVRSFNCVADTDYSNEASITTPSPASTSGRSTGGCFIATAAFGSYLDPHVETLRKFRDTFLQPSTLGNQFLGVYYRYSPPLAVWIEKKEAVRKVVRFSLLPLVAFSHSSLQWGLLPTLIGLSGFILILIFLAPRGWRKIRQTLACK